MLGVSNLLTLWIALSIFSECDSLIWSWLASVAIAILVQWLVFDPVIMLLHFAFRRLI